MLKNLDESDASIEKEDKLNLAHGTGEEKEEGQFTLELESTNKSKSPSPKDNKVRRFSPMRQNKGYTETIEEVGEYEQPQKIPVPPTTNIQSQYVVINNYNNYSYAAPPNLPPGIPIAQPGYDYNLYQQQTMSYMNYYYPPPPVFSIQPQGMYCEYGYDANKPPMEEAKTEADIEILLNQVELAVRDQPSCRLLQKKLDEGDKDVVDKIFSQLIDKVSSHMNDSFGNYLCQKLFEKCSTEQLRKVIQNVTPFTTAIATNIHGTRSIQKLIEKAVNFPELNQDIVKMLKTSITDLVMVILFKFNLM